MIWIPTLYHFLEELFDYSDFIRSSVSIIDIERI